MIFYPHYTLNNTGSREIDRQNREARDSKAKYNPLPPLKISHQIGLCGSLRSSACRRLKDSSV
jgi:hypothetical protein